MERGCFNFTPFMLDVARDISTILAFLIGIIILTNYEYKLMPTKGGRGDMDYVATINPYMNGVVNSLGYC